MEELSVYCAWCGKHISGPQRVDPNQQVSHGICSDCYVQEMEALDNIKRPVDVNKTIH